MAGHHSLDSGHSDGGASAPGAGDVVLHALAFLDSRYRYGGQSPDTGFDCSGFVRHVVEQARGQTLPRRAEDQARATQPIRRADLRPGDLVFFNTLRRPYSHVGIYVGDGRFVHAPRTGAQVRVEHMGVAYWSSRFNGARRVAASEAVAVR